MIATISSEVRALSFARHSAIVELVINRDLGPSAFDLMCAFAY